jgi:Spy/CpxP family protein refolding chaperone
MSWLRMSASTLTVGALALILTAGVTAGPQRGPRPDGPPPGPRMAGLELLDLSAEQETAVRELLQQQRQTLRPLHEQQQARMNKIDELAGAARPDPAQIGQLVIEAHAARQQVRAAMERLKESIGALLTPEQRELWSRIEAAHKKARERARGEGFGPGFGFGPGMGPGARGGALVPGEGPDE